ncbi:dihydropteroate synthase [Kiloniella sp. b19]|uniref:dihydropteroate synthase n=1 Tax=Kiloniella sp. GXU_MW_B19 TaxID=3141326 RepID=UPI0031E0AEFD
MAQRLYIRPIALVDASERREGDLALAGGKRSFSAVEALLRDEEGKILLREAGSVTGLMDWVKRSCPDQEARAAELLQRLQMPRAAFSGLPMDEPHIMAVINATPDSFSDGGDRLDPDVAVADGLRLWEAGATLLDIGGESTRPGADPVSEDEELRRVIPVIEGLKAAGTRVSIDTRHARVMREAVAAGADIINDVSGLEGDPDSLQTAVECGVPVMLMHMQGNPLTMQHNPTYSDAALDVYDYLEKRVEGCVNAGIPRDMICVDPGIGFGKTIEHNLRLLDMQALLHGTGCPVLLGVSRKSFIGRLSAGEEPKDRVAGSLACALDGWRKGVQFFRVHDVAETVQAFRIARAIAER